MSTLASEGPFLAHSEGRPPSQDTGWNAERRLSVSAARGTSLSRRVACRPCPKPRTSRPPVIGDSGHHTGMHEMGKPQPTARARIRRVQACQRLATASRMTFVFSETGNRLLGTGIQFSENAITGRCDAGTNR
jgi:hypothetical protein